MEQLKLFENSKPETKNYSYDELKHLGELLKIQRIPKNKKNYDCLKHQLLLRLDPIMGKALERAKEAGIFETPFDGFCTDGTAYELVTFWADCREAATGDLKP